MSKNDTFTHAELCFLAACRIVMPQYRAASDSFLAQKFGKQLNPVVEEIEIFLESYGIETWNQAMTIELMVAMLRALGEFISDQLYLSMTPKHLSDCISYLQPAIERKYPGCFKFGLLAFYLCPSYFPKKKADEVHA